jgi:hypothetical protein
VFFCFWFSTQIKNGYSVLHFRLQPKQGSSLQAQLVWEGDAHPNLIVPSVLSEAQLQEVAKERKRGPKLVYIEGVWCQAFSCFPKCKCELRGFREPVRSDSERVSSD